MSRRWLGILLLLSLGMNLGILGVLAVERLRGTGPSAGPGDAGVPGGSGPLPPAALRRDDRPRPFAGSRPAVPDDGAPPPVIAEHLQRLADRLGLEGEPRDKFLEIQRDFFIETLHRRRRVAELQHRFRRALAAPEVSEETLAELVQEVSEAHRSLDEGLARAVLESRELLTPDQEREYLRFLARIAPGGGRRRN